MHDPYDSDYATDSMPSDSDSDSDNIKRVRLAEPDQPALHLPDNIRSLIISYACHPLGRRTHQLVWRGFKVARTFTEDYVFNEWAVFYLGVHRKDKISSRVYKQFLGPAVQVIQVDTDPSDLIREAFHRRYCEFHKLINSINY